MLSDHATYEDGTTRLLKLRVETYVLSRLTKVASVALPQTRTTGRHSIHFSKRNLLTAVVASVIA